MSSQLDDVARGYPCTYCRAPAGAWCVRRSRSTGEVTGRASWLHNDRTAPLREAWRIGWTEGVREALADLERRLERGPVWQVQQLGEVHERRAVLYQIDGVRRSWIGRRD